MKPQHKLIAIVLAASFCLTAPSLSRAAVPLSWEVKPGQAAPVAFDRFHGESLHLTAEFVGFGEPPFAPGADVRLWYQTNGMGSAWWSAPASIDSNRVSAVWSPELDPGAERVNLFFGAPSNAYCSAVLRLRGSPGMVPNVLPLPVQRLDYAAIEVANAPYYTKSEADSKIIELAPAPGNYAAVSNAAMNAVQTETDPVWDSERDYYARIDDIEDGSIIAENANNAWMADHAIIAENLYDGSGERYGAEIIDQLDAATTTNALQDAQLSTLSTNIYTKAQLDGIVAAVFSESYDYAGNTYVLRNGKLYWCGSGHDAGPWDDDDFTEVTIGEELTRAFDDMDALTSSIALCVPKTRTVNGKALSSNITLTGADIALSSSVSTKLSVALAAAAQAATNYTDFAIAAIPDPDFSDYAAASDVAANSADIANLKVESSLVYRLYSGSNVVCEVTNYNSAVRSPTMRLLQLDTNGVYTVVWTETNNLHRVAQAATNYTDAAISAATNRFAPRAWSGVTSGLGVDAPPATTWISTPTTVLAGGYEYQKAVTSAGTVWILTSNGMTTLGPSANGSYLDIAAADGTSVFRIEKTDSYLVGAAADGITVSGNTVTISVPVIASDHPYLRYAASLESPVTWYKEEESDIPGTVSYSWSGSSGAWVCTVTTANPSGFFYFEFLQQGSTKIVNNGVTDLSGGIWFNGVKYMPHVSGTKLEFVAE